MIVHSSSIKNVKISVYYKMIYMLKLIKSMPNIIIASMIEVKLKKYLIPG